MNEAKIDKNNNSDFITEGESPRSGPSASIDPIERSINARPSDSKGNSIDFWSKMDKQIEIVTEQGLRSFRMNITINIILVGLGLFLIANSVIYTWIRGVDPWGLFSGSIGIVSFIIIFFINSQSNVNKAIANLASILMIFKCHARLYESVTDYDNRMNNPEMYSKVRTVDELSKMAEILEKSTRFYVDLVQQFTPVHEPNIKIPEPKINEEKKL